MYTPAIHTCLFKFFFFFFCSHLPINILLDASQTPRCAAPGQQLHAHFPAPQPPRSPGLTPVLWSQVSSWTGARAALSKLKRDKQHDARIKVTPNTVSVICYRERVHLMQNRHKNVWQKQSNQFLQGTVTLQWERTSLHRAKPTTLIWMRFVWVIFKGKQN